MSAVRQHYKLATTGKLGQNASVNTGKKGGSKASDKSSSSRKGSSSRSGMKKSGY